MYCDNILCFNFVKIYRSMLMLKTGLRRGKALNRSIVGFMFCVCCSGCFVLTNASIHLDKATASLCASVLPLSCSVTPMETLLGLKWQRLLDLFWHISRS